MASESFDKILDAVRAARSIQDAEHDGFGAGVSFELANGDAAFVQWCRTARPDAPWTIDRLEVSVPAQDGDLQDQLRARDFEPDLALAEFNIWCHTSEKQSWATEDELVDYLVSLTSLIGGRDGMEFTAFP